jgi:iron(III) transport system permease protein
MTAFASVTNRLRPARGLSLTLALAAAITAAVWLPPAYLIIRAAGEGGNAIWSLLTAGTTAQAVLRTLLLATTVTAACTALAVPLAWLTVRTDLPLRRLWTVFLALPLAIPSFVGGFIMVSALGPRGLMQDLLAPLGVERLPSMYGFKGSWLILTLLSYPYIYLPVRAALARIDPSLEEAARNLGSGPFGAFFKVTLPQLRPAIAAGAILVSLYVLSEFGAVSMLRYDTLTPLVYIRYTSSFDRGSAAVLGLPLIGLALLFVLLDSISRGGARYHTRASISPSRVVPLRSWRWPSVFFCGLVASFGLFLPLGVVTCWLVKGLSEGESASFVSEPLINSAYAAGLAALVTTVAAIPVSRLAVRHPGWLSGMIEKSTYTGQALPGIAIALAMVFFVANYATAFYQTLAVLVLAYVVRFLPLAAGACRSSMLQVNPHTEEVAHGLGAGPLRVFLRVTLPQMLPGISAGALLVFLTAVKELQITLLLSPAGFDTLATQIWSASSEAFFTQAALPSLLLVALSAVAVFLMLKREGAES